MQEGGTAQRARIRQSLCPFGRIEDQLNGAILDRIDHMRAAFRNFIDLLSRYALRFQIALGSGGGDNAKALFAEQLNALENARFISIADRDKDGP